MVWGATIHPIMGGAHPALCSMPLSLSPQSQVVRLCLQIKDKDEASKGGKAGVTFMEGGADADEIDVVGAWRGCHCLHGLMCTLEGKHTSARMCTQAQFCTCTHT